MLLLPSILHANVHKSFLQSHFLEVYVTAILSSFRISSLKFIVSHSILCINAPCAVRLLSCPRKIISPDMIYPQLGNFCYVVSRWQSMIRIVQRASFSTQSSTFRQWKILLAQIKCHLQARPHSCEPSIASNTLLNVFQQDLPQITGKLAINLPILDDQRVPSWPLDVQVLKLQMHSSGCSSNFPSCADLEDLCLPGLDYIISPDVVAFAAPTRLSEIPVRDRELMLIL